MNTITVQEPGMSPDSWKKLLKILIAVLTALAGCFGVSAAAGLFPFS